MFVKLIKGLSS